MVVVGAAGVNKYVLSSAWDISSASYSQAFSVSSQENDPQALFFKSDGTKMYVLGSGSDTVYQYTTGDVDYPTASPVTVTGLTNGTSYTFNVWAINPFGWSSPSDASGSVSPVQAAFAMVAGFGSGTVNIDRYNINSAGNASDFGDLTSGRNSGNVMSSATRTVFSCGRDAGNAFINALDYVNPTSQGNATNFGSASYAKQYGSQFGSTTRGCVGGAEGPSQGAPNYQSYDTIDYITFASTGNALDFGNQTQITQKCAGFGSTTRGVRAGGNDGAGGGSTETNVMDYVTIASTGNATDFGDMTRARKDNGSCSSSTRGLNAGGSGNTNSIDYVTIASTGNAIDFGDLISIQGTNIRAASSEITGTFIKTANTIVAVTIATTGNAIDFGDLTGTSSDAFMAGSNGGGGLQ
jgi:hypothetical protein